MNAHDEQEVQRDLRDYADTGINHVLGFKNEDIRLVPDYNAGFAKDARITDRRRQNELIEEEGLAANFAGKMDIAGTHYEHQSPAEIAMSMPRGL